MKLVEIPPGDLIVSPELSRSGRAKSFEDRLRSSIEQIGLTEPLKVAPLPSSGYLVIDGTIRLRAIRAIRAKDPKRFETVATYVFDYQQRFEIRYQSDIYQDLFPSQLAGLVEHLHRSENVLKSDIARYIGVSPATLRNYTGLWRLLQRGGLFAKIVDLMDVGVIPSSNPYAWLRLTASGLSKVLSENFTESNEIDEWIEQTLNSARRGGTLRFPIKFVEAVTDGLPDEYYRVGQEVRSIKRDFGLRKKSSNLELSLSVNSSESVSGSAGAPAPVRVPAPAPGDVQDPAPVRAPRHAPARASDSSSAPASAPGTDPDYLNSLFKEAFKKLTNVSMHSSDPVLRSAARSLQEYLQ